MDFDEYDYLEKAVEFTGAPKEKVEHRSSRHDHRDRRDDRDEKGESRRALKKPKDEEQNGERRDRREDRERTPLRREKDHHHRDREDRDKERRSGDENRDRDKEKERRSRDENRDREREEKERKRERERRSSSRSRRHDREAEIETEREGPRRSSSMSGRHDREAEMDMERERSRRSSSRSARQDREVELERERARSLDRAVREREAERELRERESRRLKDKKEVEPEADPERDQRTVFAYQMPLKATERDVYEFFTRAGKVRDVRLIMDRNSRRSKGVGYIEFYDVGSVQAALQLSGQLLLGQPVMVKHSEAEKNLVQSTAAGGSALAPGSERKLYVGNLHFNMNEEQLRQIFEAFGPVELVQLPLDMETGQCKGFGFVQFAQIEHAKAAQQSLNGTLEIAGRIVKVSSVTEHVGVQDTGTNVTDFDDDDGGGLALNARSRAILMQKLDRTGTATSIVGSLGVPVLNGSVPTTLGAPAVMTTVPSTFPTVLKTTVVEPIGDPSECILLKNMFDPSTETDLDFDLDIKEDVQDECSKFGMVKHIYVDKNSNGHVYLRFDSVAAAANCQRAMHMRWFARRCISATYMRLHEYEAKMRSVGAA